MPHWCGWGAEGWELVSVNQRKEKVKFTGVRLNGPYELPTSPKPPAGMGSAENALSLIWMQRNLWHSLLLIAIWNILIQNLTFGITKPTPYVSWDFKLQSCPFTNLWFYWMECIEYDRF